MTSPLSNYFLAYLLKKNCQVSFAIEKQVRLGDENYFYRSCEIGFDTYTARGYGVDLDPDEARLKCLMEAVENLTLKQNQVSGQNGSASHFFSKTAFSNAYCEMLERDAYVRCFLNLESPVFYGSENEVEFFDLQIRNAKAFCFIATMLEDGEWLFGLGCSFNRANALSSAKRELVLMLVTANALKNSRKPIIDHKHSLPVDFYQRIRNSGIHKSPAEKTNTSYQVKSLNGISKFVVSTKVIYSNDLFLWDVDWLNGTTKAGHSNSILLNRLSMTARKR